MTAMYGSDLSLGFGASIGATRRSGGSAHFTVKHMLACGQRPDRDLHVHECVDLLLPLDGGFYSEAVGFQPDAPARQIIITPPGQPHRDSMERRGGRFITISISPELLDGFDQAAHLPKESLAIADPSILRCAYMMSAALSDRDASHDLLECIGLDLLANLTLRHGQATPPCVLRGIEVIRDGPPDSRQTISEIAAQAGVHPIYFARAFRLAVGCAPSEYSLRSKIMQAASLLAGQEPNLAGIATDFGFVDQSHFTRCFKRAMGVTPGRFRRSFA